MKTQRPEGGIERCAFLGNRCDERLAPLQAELFYRRYFKTPMGSDPSPTTPSWLAL
jgi:hypothetical protein